MSWALCTFLNFQVLRKQEVIIIASLTFWNKGRWVFKLEHGLGWCELDEEKANDEWNLKWVNPKVD